MFNRFTFAFVGGIGLVLAGCAPAPAPAPIYPEPTFDKFGNLQYSSEDSCVPIRPEQFDPTQGYYVNDGLLPCCPPGSEFNQRTMECVPIPQRPNDDDDRPSGDRPTGTQTDPTRA
ncbi:hypothetical protein [Celeribacter sp. SCSIO 80788]|uniref:hypothetical protein n=1 Tax=Celeribacter sp. SCSIO 80788 TaxID=3117013 RepID=UPI003DA61735